MSWKMCSLNGKGPLIYIDIVEFRGLDGVFYLFFNVISYLLPLTAYRKKHNHPKVIMLLGVYGLLVLFLLFVLAQVSPQWKCELLAIDQGCP